MAQDHIRYDVLTQDALRGVVRKVLGEVEKVGLPGDHHFFITFATKASGVRISKKLLEQYEEEMTIVIQHRYKDLKTSETSFEISLAFDGVEELLIIPYAALKGFFDPSVEFGMQFEPTHTNLETENKPAQKAKDTDDSSASDQPNDKSDEAETAEKDNGDKVISLDSFRKK